MTLLFVALVAFSAGWVVAWWFSTEVRRQGLVRFQQAEYIVRLAEGRAAPGRVTAGDIEWARRRAREERLGMGQ